MSVLSNFMPELFLSFAGCLLLIVGLFFPRSVKYLGILSILFAVYLLKDFVLIQNSNSFSNLFRFDILEICIKLILLVSALIYVIAYSFINLKSKFLDQYEYVILVIFALVGMIMMISSNHFLSLYIGIELQGLCIAVLASFERGESKSAEAGLKYFTLAAFASGLLLFGISLIYGFTGSLDFSNLANFLANNPSHKAEVAIIIGIVLVLIGVFFKTSAAPFHMWTPDVFEGAPTIVSAFLATISKIAAIGVLMALTLVAFKPWKLELQPIYLTITILSLLTGAIGALKQNNLKRMLAYSSIGHVGFMMLAISTFIFEGSLLIYLVVYFAMTFGVFLLILNSSIDNKAVTSIDDLKGIARTHPVVAASYAIFMFSLAGIPPFAGFFAKFLVFESAINSGFYVSSIIAIFSAVISAFYYLRIVKVMYLDHSEGSFSYEGKSIPVKSILVALVFFNLFYMLIS